MIRKYSEYIKEGELRPHIRILPTRKEPTFIPITPEEDSLFKEAMEYFKPVFDFNLKYYKEEKFYISFIGNFGNTTPPYQFMNNPNYLESIQNESTKAIAIRQLISFYDMVKGKFKFLDYEKYLDKTIYMEDNLTAFEAYKSFEYSINYLDNPKLVIKVSPKYNKEIDSSNQPLNIDELIIIGTEIKKIPNMTKSEITEEGLVLRFEFTT